MTDVPAPGPLEPSPWPFQKDGGGEAAVDDGERPTPATAGSPLEVFLAFLRLGLTAFGGPVAHLGYFRAEFVGRRGWLDERAYAELVALCQVLPGPASSQAGFGLGLHRAGLAGGLAAWAGFTLPSAALMVGFAWAAGSLGGSVGQAALHGLKLVAVAVVAQAVWGMASSLAPDGPRAAIAAAAAALVLAAGPQIGQPGAIVLGVAAGLLLRREDVDLAPVHLRLQPSRTLGAAALCAFSVLLAGSLLWPGGGPAGVFAAFYRAGALVFGGGHVVLPLLQAAVVAPGWVSQPDVLAGYGAAQALPGPLFTFAAYLGVLARAGPGGIAGGALALVAVFLPGLLLMVGAPPFWEAVRRRPAARAAIRGANAAVVGVLAAALYDPVGASAIRGRATSPSRWPRWPP